MWLTNLSHSNVKALYIHKIFFDAEDLELALQFMRVLRICMVFRIHAGTDWKAISDKYFKKDAANPPSSQSTLVSNPRRFERFLLSKFDSQPMVFDQHSNVHPLPSDHHCCCWFRLENPGIGFCTLPEAIEQISIGTGLFPSS
ncbi:hypothetical protein E3N88_13708 [Mikania micrantha]|uniref:Uncharacterized protein n=1 Tax=Mikania micrantha TaxID=192012 RepID=A0A5N6P0J7_9ASTR|nr:hypothetical protein E3N88_13708 [Mikania micrantha]